MSENIPLNNDDAPRQQSSLGKIIPKRLMQTMMVNSLTFGTVTNVDYTTGRAVVSVTDKRYANNSTTINGAIIPVEFYNYDLKGNVYGQYRPLATGTRVLVGYVNKNLATPIILGVYPDDSNNMKQISPSISSKENDSTYPMRNFVLTQKIVYPSQQISVLTEQGDMFRTFNSGSLLTVTTDNKVDEAGYDGSDSTWDMKQDGSGEFYQPNTTPQSILLLHKSDLPKYSHMTRLFVGKDGRGEAIWSDPQDETKVLYANASKDKGMVIGYQHDTSDRVDPITTKYTTTEWTSDNTFLVTARDGTLTGTLEVTPNGTIVDGMKIASEKGLQSISNQLSSIQNTVGNLNTTINKVGTNYITNLPETINSLRRDIDTNANNVSTNKVDIHTNTNDIVGLKTKTDSLKSSIDVGYTNLLNRINSFGDKVGNYTDIQQKVNTLYDYHSTVKAMVDTYATDKSTFLTKDSDIIKEKDTQIKNLQSKVASLESVVKQLASKANVTLPDDFGKDTEA